MVWLGRCQSAPAAGAGYELALACDDILLVDDRSSACSLPEVPLLGAAGTGGLTRWSTSAHVRRDLAYVFATRTEGIRGARPWMGSGRRPSPPHQVRRGGDQPGPGPGRSVRTARPSRRHLSLTPPRGHIDGDMIRYLTSSPPDRSWARRGSRCPARPTQYLSARASYAAGASFWPRRWLREFDDAMLQPSASTSPELGTWFSRRKGDLSAVLALEDGCGSTPGQLAPPGDHAVCAGPSSASTSRPAPLVASFTRAAATPAPLPKLAPGRRPVVHARRPLRGDATDRPPPGRAGADRRQ